jgi:3-deoxy-manno-octulosonate cytidylyltransferase (CMP-KDO synthetase)
MTSVLAVIPARYESTRFPGKALALIGKRTMLEEVWRRSSQAEKISRLVVATDDERISSVATGFGAEVLLTSPDHSCGTDRVAEVVNRLDERFEVVLNIQGDEPLLTPTSLDRLIDAFAAAPPPGMATLATPITEMAEVFDPNVVKIVATEDGRALYFSRSAIPYLRANVEQLPADFSEILNKRAEGFRGFLKHQGIYAYSTEVLLALTSRGPSTLERFEGLEQLRALQAGYPIQIVDSDFNSISVDTPADLQAVNEFFLEAT